MHWLTSSLVRPECIILLRRVILQSLREYPHGFTEKKCRGRANNYASREKWPSLLNMSRAAVTGGGKGRPMHLPLDQNLSIPIGCSDLTWRQHRQSHAFQPLFTRFLLDRYFWESATKTCTTDVAMSETLALHSWNILSVQLHDRPLLCFKYRICFYRPLITSQIIGFIIEITLQW